MKKIRMRLKDNSYDIVIGKESLPQLGGALKRLKLGPDSVVVTTPAIWKLHGKELEGALKKAKCSVKVFSVPDGEKSKSAQTAFGLLQKITQYDVGKKIFLVAFGGGVIGDLTGFVASVYKRGIPYIQVPTTFLAQIDSAIGGKAAVDLPIGKNLVGSIYQPKLVFSDVVLLKTLSSRQIRNGLAEAVKYGVIYDARLFNDLNKNYKDVLNLHTPTLKRVVYACGKIKTDVVEQDEKETKSIRTILNFGHTVGHAIEAAGAYKVYQHGEAIALGMRVAARISVRLGLLSSKDEKRLNELLTKIGLPKEIKNVKVAEILNHMKHDKKFVASKNRLVLAKTIGSVKVVDNISQDVIVNSIRVFMG